jgi:hypothetical protein
VSVQFYDVKARAKVDVAEGDIRKTKYVRKLTGGSTQTRYALRAKHNGVNLTKFVNQQVWDSMNVPEE